MKRILLALIFMLSVLAAAVATPPSDIIITFDLSKSMVFADIIHETKAPKDHYIYMVQVNINGKKAIKQEMTEQLNSALQKVAYIIPGLKAGDKVSVDADCNKYGDLTVEAVAKDAPAKKDKKKK